MNQNEHKQEAERLLTAVSNQFDKIIINLSLSGNEPDFYAQMRVAEMTIAKAQVHATLANVIDLTHEYGGQT